MATPPRPGRGRNPGRTGNGPQIRFGHVDFGHFDIGNVPGTDPFHFDIGGSGLFGSHNDDPWHEDRQFIDNNHGDGHNDSHTDDPGYPDSDHNDSGHNDRHNDQHADDPDYPDDKHTDHYDHSDNHSDYQDAPDDDRTSLGRKLGDIGRAIQSIQVVINRIIGQQRQTLQLSERQVSGLSKQLLTRLVEADKRIEELDGRLAKLEGKAPATAKRTSNPAKKSADKKKDAKKLATRATSSKSAGRTRK